MKADLALCTQDFPLSDDFKLERGKEYTVSAKIYEDGTTIVFTRYWARVPNHLFTSRIPAYGYGNTPMANTEPKIPLKSGGEYDALTRWRKICNIRPRFWKKKYRKRFRQQSKKNLRQKENSTEIGGIFREGSAPPI